MRVLVAGCGYVGLSLGADLVKRGHHVDGITRTGERRVEIEKAGICPLIANIIQPEDLDAIEAKYDWVVNCVASSGGTAADYEQLYLRGTRNLVDWLTPTPPKKFVYTSSTSVYGQTNGSLVDENSRTEPEAETSKVLGQTELLLQNAWRKHEFPAVILRVAGIYGPGRGFWFKQFVRGEARVDASGDRWLNMIHRDDLIPIIMMALEKGKPGEIYNCVDNEPVRQREFFQWLAEELGRPMPRSGETRQSPERKRVAANKRVSNEKLRNSLGYNFLYPTFREGYREEIEAIKASSPRA